jgi:uncharacterized protein
LSGVNALSESKAIEILLALESEPKHVRQLQRELNGSLTTVKTRVDELIKDGLIQEVSAGLPSRLVTLTEKGKVWVKLLNEMDGERVSVVSGHSRLTKRSEWLLIMIYALQQVRGSTRLEKLLFLLKEKYSPIGNDFYQFVPETYGPFSAEALNDAKRMASEGLIRIENQPFPQWDGGDVIIRKDYALTEKGRKVAEKAFAEAMRNSDFGKVVDELKAFNGEPLTLLLKQVHEKWPQYCS